MLPAEAQKRQQERSLHQRVQREADLRHLMELSHFQRFIFDHLDQVCGVTSGSFRADVAHPELVMAFNEGRRSVGLELQTELQRVAPASYVATLTAHVRAENSEAEMRRAEAVPRAGERLGP